MIKPILLQEPLQPFATTGFALAVLIIWVWHHAKMEFQKRMLRGESRCDEQFF